MYTSAYKYTLKSHTHTLTNMRAHMHAHMRAHMRAHMHAHMHTYKLSELVIPVTGLHRTLFSR